MHLLLKIGLESLEQVMRRICGSYVYNNILDIDKETKPRIIDEEARRIIATVCKVKNAVDMQKFDIVVRNTYLKELKEEYSLSIRQIERITGINRGIVLKV